LGVEMSRTLQHSEQFISPRAPEPRAAEKVSVCQAQPITFPHVARPIDYQQNHLIGGFSIEGQ
jgi:hypothetical protein